MKCHSPINIADPQQGNNKVRLIVPCGRCTACHSNRRSEWVTRLHQESKKSESAYFITLTYAQEYERITENGLLSLLKSDTQEFFKKLRKTQSGKIKYYMVGEYGDRFFRPHYHILLFNMEGNLDEIHITLLNTWGMGIVHISPVTIGRFNYTLKDMMKQQNKEWLLESVPPFRTSSKNLGLNYVQSHFDWHQADIERNYVATEGGGKRRLPRYYREKIYDKGQRNTQNYNSDQKNREIERNKDITQQKEELRLEHDQYEQIKRTAEKLRLQNSQF